MRTKVHGLTSIGFIFLAILLAEGLTWRLSVLLAIGYMLLVFLAFAVVIASYCSKCPCKGRCPHIIPGWLAERIHRQPGRYTRLELTLLVLSLSMILLLPNFWIAAEPLWLIPYWGLILIGIIQIRTFVCSPFGNIFCPAHLANTE